MARKDSQSAQTVARLIQTVDDSRGSDDPFKLTLTLRNTLDNRLTDLVNAESKQGGASGDRAKDAETLRVELPKMRELLRDGYKHVDGLKSYEISRAEKISALDAYGWVGGKIGSLAATDRVLALARQVEAATPTVAPAQARYPTELVTRISDKLIVLENAGAGARIGSRQGATKRRNDALKALQKIIARTRLYLGSCSDDLDATPELARVGLNPTSRSGQRRVPSEVVPPPDGTLPPVVVK